LPWWVLFTPKTGLRRGKVIRMLGSGQRFILKSSSVERGMTETGIDLIIDLLGGSFTFCGNGFWGGGRVSTRKEKREIAADLTRFCFWESLPNFRRTPGTLVLRERERPLTGKKGSRYAGGDLFGGRGP